MKTLEQLNLRDNPFKHVTPDPNNFKIENPLWAGLDDIKVKLEEIYKNLAYTDGMRVTLNWGP